MVWLKRIREFLNRPAYLIISGEKKWYYILAISVLIPVMLNLQQPFGIHCWNHPFKQYLLCGFGINFLLSYLLIYRVLPLAYKRYFLPANWTIQKDVLISLLLFILFGVTNWLYEAFIIDKADTTIRSFFEIQCNTFVFGLLPKTCVAILAYLKSKSINLQPEKVLEQNSIEEQNKAGNTDILQLNTDSILVHTIQYIRVVENYATLYLYSNGKQQKLTYNKSLKEIELSLKPYSQFIRCYKSYLVNTHHIKASKCNSAGGNLLLENYTDKIPVSRKYYPRVKASLSR